MIVHCILVLYILLLHSSAWCPVYSFIYSFLRTFLSWIRFGCWIVPFLEHELVILFGCRELVTSCGLSLYYLWIWFAYVSAIYICARLQAPFYLLDWTIHS